MVSLMPLTSVEFLNCYGLKIKDKVDFMFLYVYRCGANTAFHVHFYLY